jgi:hypothetical protein
MRVPNDRMAEYYTSRASAGLIITGATVISEQRFGWVDSPGIYNDAQVAGWKMTTSALHAKGLAVFLQLGHCGRASHRSVHGGKPAVSDRRARGGMSEGGGERRYPRDLTADSAGHFAFHRLVRAAAEHRPCASARVRPARLFEGGFPFRFPNLDGAMRHLLASAR